MEPNLGQRCGGVPLYIRWSKVMYQGQGSSEVKLGGKCVMGIFVGVEKLMSNYNQT